MRQKVNPAFIGSDYWRTAEERAICSLGQKDVDAHLEAELLRRRAAVEGSS